MDASLKDELQKYLHALMVGPDLQYLRPPYLAARNLTDLYIEPGVHQVAQGSHKDECDLSPLFEWQELVDHQDSQWRSIVTGGPGAGKSLLLRMTARRLAARAARRLEETAVPEELPLPIYMSLPFLAEVRISPDELPAVTLRRAIKRAILLEPVTSVVDETIADYLSQHASQDGWWILLDFHDARCEPNDISRVFRELQRYSSHLVIAARSYEVEKTLPPFAIQEYRLAPLSARQIDAFIGKWFTSESDRSVAVKFLRRSRSASELAQVPLLLTLLCGCLARGKVSEDITRSELYDRLLVDLLGRQPTGAEVVDEGRAAEWLPALSDVAIRHFENSPQSSEIETSELLHLLATSDKRPPVREIDAEKPVPQSNMERASNLLGELRDKGVLFPARADNSSDTFLHPSILEYLAGYGLAQRVDAWPRNEQAFHEAWADVDRKAPCPTWEPVILFLAAKLRNPGLLLSRLRNPANDDCFRHCLALAARCLGEIPKDRRGVSAAEAKKTSSAFRDQWIALLVRTGMRPWALRNYPEALHTVMHLDRDGRNAALLKNIAGLLRDGSPAQRTAAAAGARMIGAAAATIDILAGLVTMLQKYEVDAAARAVGEMGVAAARDDVLRALLSCAEEGRFHDPESVPMAIASLGQISKSAQVIEHLLTIIQRGKPRARTLAVNVLCRLDMHAAVRIVVDLRNDLKNTKGDTTGQRAILAKLVTPEYQRLAQLVGSHFRGPVTPVDKATRRAFSRHFRSGSPLRRAIAGWALAVLGLSHQQPYFAIKLLALLRERPPICRVALEIVALADWLWGQFPIVNRVCAMAMCGPTCDHARNLVKKMGPVAISPELTDWLGAELSARDVRTRTQACALLQSLGPCAATEKVLNSYAQATNCGGAKAPDALLAEFAWAARVLGTATDRKDVVQQLFGLAKHENSGVRCAAARALGKMRSDWCYEERVEAIRGLLKDNSSEVREAASIAIRDSGRHALRTDFREDVERLLQSADKGAQRSAAKAASRIRPGKGLTPELVNNLMQQLHGEFPAAKHAAARTLVSLMNQGIRIFEQPEDEHGHRWFSRTVDELAHMDTVLGERVGETEIPIPRAVAAGATEIANDGTAMTAAADIVVQPGGAPPEAASNATHSPDYRSVNWFGKKYQFSPMQAACVGVLWEAWQKGTPALGQDTILEKADSLSARLVDLFKKRTKKARTHPAWMTMIVPGETKGSFRLKEPRAD